MKKLIAALALTAGLLVGGQTVAQPSADAHTYYGPTYCDFYARICSRDVCSPVSGWNPFSHGHECYWNYWYI